MFRLQWRPASTLMFVFFVAILCPWFLVVAESTASEQVEMVMDIAVGPGPSPENPTYITPLGDGVVFLAKDARHRIELWFSDGLPGGSGILRDVHLGPRSSTVQYQQTTTIDGEAYYVLDDGIYAGEVWKTDGTAVGTVRVSDSWPGYGYYEPDWLTKSALSFFSAPGRRAPGRSCG